MFSYKLMLSYEKALSSLIISLTLLWVIRIVLISNCLNSAKLKFYLLWKRKYSLLLSFCISKIL